MSATSTITERYHHIMGDLLYGKQDSNLHKVVTLEGLDS